MRKWNLAVLLLAGAAILPGCSSTEDLGRMVNGYTYQQEKEQYILENDQLTFVLDPETTYFTVTDKTSKKEWSSNPVQAAEDQLASGENKQVLQSTLTVGYNTTGGVGAVMNNFGYSIEKGTYEIEEADNGLTVRYSIGNIDKRFVIPPALPESEMNVYMEKMDNSAQKQVREYYRKYDINNLRSGDNRSELLTLYPELKNECVFVLRNGLQDHIKRKMEDSFAGAGYTEEAFAADEERYRKEEEEDVPVFDVTVKYTLEGSDLMVEIPFEELAWKSTYPMTQLTVLPFIGAGSQEEDGFVLVPEGPGGVITFNNGKTKQNSYYADAYGWDLAQNRTALIDESRTAYPVFALSKEGGSMLCILEEGAAFAAIEADVSGRNNSYNYAHAVYRILHGESLDVSAKSDKSVVVFEQGLPKGKITQRYRFLDTSSYAEMASSYRSYLMEKYPNLEKVQEEKAPVMITMIGAIDKMKQRFGFPMSVPVPLTTYKEAKELLEDLSDRGYEHVFVKYSGWMNGGVTHSLPKTVKPVSELGSKNDLQQVASCAQANEIHFYLDGSVRNAYKSGFSDGFAVNRDSARYASREVAELFDFSKVWYGPLDNEEPHYLLKPQLSIQLMDKLSKAASGYQAGVSYSDIGYLLGADYSTKNHISRQAVLGMEAEVLSRQAKSGQGIMLNYGNDYAVAYADAVTDMDLYGKSYALIDRFVPFYPMTLHGLVPYAGNSVNLSGDYTQMVLKSAEMGAALSFTFMKENAFTLQESGYTRYYGTDYDLWAEKAAEITRRYQEELGSCFNQYMADHDYLAEGVTVTVYEDGTEVYVNYNDTEYQGPGITIAARDYLVKGR